MKIKILAISTLAVLAVLGLLAYGSGRGQVVALGTNEVVRIALGSTEAARTCSIYVKGGADIWAAVNCDTSTFATAVTAGTAVPIASGTAYTFDGKALEIIRDVCLRAQGTGTAQVHVATY